MISKMLKRTGQEKRPNTLCTGGLGEKKTEEDRNEKRIMMDL